MKVIVVSGFSRSGKSTLNSALVKAGIPTASSSEVLDIETLKYLNIPVTPYRLSVLVNKQERDFKSLIKQFNPTVRELNTIYYQVEGSAHTQGTSIRDFKKHVAEDVIVPERSRIFFASKCLSMLEAYKREPRGVIFSTIQKEREDLYSAILTSNFTTDLIRCNIVSPLQQEGVDYRSLIELPDFQLTNTLEGSEVLLRDFMALVKNFEKHNP